MLFSSAIILSAALGASSLVLPDLSNPIFQESLSQAVETARDRSFGLVDQQTVLRDLEKTDGLRDLKKDEKVNITLGVMSRCPDAEYCEGIFDKVLDRVGGLVNFELTYIGSVDDSEEYGVKCKHGPGECLGNIHQLCVRQAQPAFSAWFQTFVDCVNYGKQGDEDSARECARLAAIDWDKEVASCVNGNQGRQLLRESVERSKALGIDRSCSVLYSDRVVCIHDDGEWTCDRHDIADFSQRARKEWDRLNDD